MLSLWGGASLDRELRRGTLGIAVLIVLLRGSTYGYDLANTLRRESGGIFDVKEGTLYPLLYRMEDEGWLVGGWKIPDRGKPRRYYRITEKGRHQAGEQLASWRELNAVMELMVAGSEGDARGAESS